MHVVVIVGVGVVVSLVGLAVVRMIVVRVVVVCVTVMRVVVMRMAVPVTLAVVMMMRLERRAHAVRQPQRAGRVQQRDARDQRRRTERRLRHQVDDLRYAMKRAQPPLDPTSTFDASVPQLQALPEFRELERLDGGLDAARTAWERFARRELEKRHDAAYTDLDGASEERKRKDAPPDPALDPRAVRRRVRYDTGDEPVAP